MAQEEAEEELEAADGPIRPRVRGGRVLARKIVDGVLYQSELVQCGKRRVKKDGSEWVCQCMTGGRLHGPYWYAYTTARSRGGRVAAGGAWRRKYHGSEPPG